MLYIGAFLYKRIENRKGTEMIQNNDIKNRNDTVNFCKFTLRLL